MPVLQGEARKWFLLDVANAWIGGISPPVLVILEDVVVFLLHITENHQLNNSLLHNLIWHEVVVSPFSQNRRELICT